MAAILALGGCDRKTDDARVVRALERVGFASITLTGHPLLSWACGKRGFATEFEGLTARGEAVTGAVCIAAFDIQAPAIVLKGEP